MQIDIKLKRKKNFFFFLWIMRDEYWRKLQRCVCILMWTHIPLCNFVVWYAMFVKKTMLKFMNNIFVFDEMKKIIRFSWFIYLFDFFYLRTYFCSSFSTFSYRWIFLFPLNKLLFYLRIEIPLSFHILTSFFFLLFTQVRKE